ncbi:hypothetical protein FACS1894218_5190 [Bacilli bacterium]|nr:hypothetical protein FACS1894218_5190 [Bacilli bacterium]
MASSKKKQIRLKKVTVSKPRNLISFAFNIAAISLIGITTTLFLISSLITWNGITDWYSGYARSSFF